MSGFNWIDFILIVSLMIGMAIGFSQGLIRQLIGLAAIYIGFVVATQFFQMGSRTLASLLKSPPNTLSNMVTFFVIFFVVVILVNFLGLDAYRSTRLKLVPALDHTTGMILGLISMWIFLTIAVNVLLFSVTTEIWGGTAELYRSILQVGLQNSRIAEVTATTLPIIVSTVRPWLPGGLPALFNL